jgi:hypothetical protein
MQLARGSNWREQYIIRPGDGANVTRYRESRTFKRERVACNVARGTVHSFSEWRALQSIVRN